MVWKNCFIFVIKELPRPSNYVFSVSSAKINESPSSRHNTFPLHLAQIQLLSSLRWPSWEIMKKIKLPIKRYLNQFQIQLLEQKYWFRNWVLCPPPPLYLLLTIELLCPLWHPLKGLLDLVHQLNPTRTRSTSYSKIVFLSIRSLSIAYL